MFKYSVVMLLSAVLVLQHTCALPAAEVRHNGHQLQQLYSNAQAKQIAAKSSEDLDNTPRNRLQQTVIDESVALSKYVIEEGRIFFKNVVDELQALPEKSAAIQRNITTYSQLLERLRKLDLNDEDLDTDQLFDGANAISDVFQAYDNMPASADKATMEKAFEKCGLPALDVEYEKKALELSERFMKAFDEYVATLSAQEKSAESKMLDWYECFKAEKDVEKKIDAFEEFLQFFETANFI